MSSERNTSSRRGFLGQCLKTGVAATGLIGGVASGTAAGANVRSGERVHVFGHKQYSMSVYELALDTYSSVSRGEYADPHEDFAYGSVIDGEVGDYGEHQDDWGYDSFEYDGNGDLRNVSVDGEVTVFITPFEENNCDTCWARMPPSYDITIRGEGEYTIGWWVRGSAEGGDVESGQTETCILVPNADGDLAYMCRTDPEGVVDVEVDVYGETRKREVATGHMSGNLDSYHVESGAGLPRYLHLKGDLYVSIEKED